MTKNELKPAVDSFLNKLRAETAQYYAERLPNLPVPEIRAEWGRSYIRIVMNNSAWGFIALKDSPRLNAKAGDLLKTASWKAPAKHPRGSILDGTAAYTQYGVAYLN